MHTNLVFVAAAVHWFSRQPYTIPVPLFPIRIDWKALIHLGDIGVRGAGQLALLALPVLLMFGGSLQSWNRRAAAVFGVGFLCIVVSGIALIRARMLYVLVAPFVPDYMIDSSFRRLTVIAALGIQFNRAHDGLGVSLTAAVVFGILCLAVCVFAGAHRRATSPQETNFLTWPQLSILLGSFSAAYIVVLTLTELRNGYFFDRYLLPLLAILLLVLTRYYQERVKAKLPRACAILIVVFGAFSVVATHDTFALYRGYATAIHEIESIPVPATAIAGPWEFEGWTQVETAGYMNDARIEIPRGAYVPRPLKQYPAHCAESSTLDMVPAIKPVYVVSLDPQRCGGQVAMSPVIYRTWIAPRTNLIYALKFPADFPR